MPALAAKARHYAWRHITILLSVSERTRARGQTVKSMTHQADDCLRRNCVLEEGF